MPKPGLRRIANEERKRAGVKLKDLVARRARRVAELWVSGRDERAGG